MKNLFNNLLNNSTGNFTYEPNETVEVNVYWAAAEIVVVYYSTKKKLLTLKKETYHSLHGMFGKPTVEQKFNEIIANF